jgi:hypothetical protein
MSHCNGGRRPRSVILTLLLGGSVAAVGTGCTDALLPPAPADTEILEGPVEGLSPGQLAVFTKGDEEFARRFTVADGVGPLFIAQ